ncbi:MAG: acetate/propionate family kinase [Acidobacteriaceae bacterium]
MPTEILALNSGSSSLKFGLYAVNGEKTEPLYSGSIQGIHTSKSNFVIRNTQGVVLLEDNHVIASQQDAIELLSNSLRLLPYPKPAAIGHRLVHGGPHLLQHQRITPAVLEQLHEAAIFAPLHVPVALELIEAATKHFHGTPQFACFDTAFHATMPEVATHFALPKKLWDAGVHRYGFHGLSCESIMATLRAESSPLPKRVIIAHLGNGASLTAVLDGESIDTTMGLTPTGGIVMGTRPGDLDPGVLLHLLRTTEYATVSGKEAAAKLEHLLNHESGLLGLSDATSDMRQLGELAAEDPAAAMAIEIFCRTAKKALAGLIAVLGGVDLLVFTGGIGQHDAHIRKCICEGLEFAGIRLNEEANQKGDAVISRQDSQVSVRVLCPYEELQIARLSAHLLRKEH